MPATGVVVEMISRCLRLLHGGRYGDLRNGLVAAETACDCVEDCSEETLLRARLCLRALSACIASYWNVSLSIRIRVCFELENHHQECCQHVIRYE